MRFLTPEEAHKAELGRLTDLQATLIRQIGGLPKNGKSNVAKALLDVLDEINGRLDRLEERNKYLDDCDTY